MKPIFRRMPAVPLLLAVLAAVMGMDANGTGQVQRPELILVNQAGDEGPGSLRAALSAANDRPGAVVIRFDSVNGPFAEPRQIDLASPLPPIRGDVTVDGFIEDRLWRPSGVTLSGGGNQRVFEVEKGGRLTLAYLTVADGSADVGGGILNRGRLVVRACTMRDNVAVSRGGGIAAEQGSLAVINSTFFRNSARKGGGVYSHATETVVTNATFADNAAERGGGLASDGPLRLRNSILADSRKGSDCFASSLSEGSTHNLIEDNAGCGTPWSSADPGLRSPGYYNGPTQTIPLEGGSPAINFGDNASAVGETGEPLRWDQRGNGDPRFVSGITDIGAFEVQIATELVVDSLSDGDLRGCLPRRLGDCSLRGALALAKGAGKAAVIRFDRKVFGAAVTLEMNSNPPIVASEVTIDGKGLGPVEIRCRLPECDPSAFDPLELVDVSLAQ
jgi:hypothetical protein